nr:MAG TPA_asm: hypothetical protein [Caudoviricetes sp.]
MLPIPICNHSRAVVTFSLARSCLVIRRIFA